jgi:aminomethyltransferase
MSESTDQIAGTLRQTPLFDAHIERGARMAPFAGYAMPIQYPTGIIEEHVWTRTRASVFDISHMGQAIVLAKDGRHETAASALEALLPADLLGLAPGQQRYSQLLNADGGVIDDLIVTRPFESSGNGKLILVLNAARKDADLGYLAAQLAESVRTEPQPELALIALQGPKSGEILGALCPESRDLRFMQATRARIGACECGVSRSGYTGEDGFEISVAASDAPDLWRALLDCEDVRPCGLGARDSLRLEAGLCLYGHELDETISPVEAGLAWSIPRGRRTNGGFPGQQRILDEIGGGPARMRVGILPEGRAPARDGAMILSPDGDEIGVVTSGGYSPTLKRPIAMGYVTSEHARPETRVMLVVRGASLDARIVRLPFVPHAYRRAAEGPPLTVR